VRALAEAIDPRYRVLIYTAAYTGLRWGELGALRVRDVKLNRLEVNEALKEINGELSFGPTKTHADRAVSLPAFLRELLAEQIGTEPVPRPAALVFTGPDGGPLRHSGFYRRHFKPAVKAALPPELHALRFHDLRHTCASLLIAAGAHAKSIQARLGHSTITMTMDRYGHLLPSLDDALAATLDATHDAAAMPERATSSRYRRPSVREPEQPSTRSAIDVQVAVVPHRDRQVAARASRVDMRRVLAIERNAVVLPLQFCATNNDYFRTDQVHRLAEVAAFATVVRRDQDVGAKADAVGDHVTPSFLLDVGGNKY
jgi:hypothetical protein